MLTLMLNLFLQPETTATFDSIHRLWHPHAHASFISTNHKAGTGHLLWGPVQASGFRPQASDMGRSSFQYKPTASPHDIILSRNSEILRAHTKSTDAQTHPKLPHKCHLLIVSCYDLFRHFLLPQKSFTKISDAQVLPWMHTYTHTHQKFTHKIRYLNCCTASCTMIETDRPGSYQRFPSSNLALSIPE